MAGWASYKGLQVPDVPTGDAGINLKDDLKLLADRDVFTASSDPTINSDVTDNYSIGSLWFNSATQTLWTCIDASNGAAKWRSLFRRVENALVLAPNAAIGGSDGRAIQLDHSVSEDARGANAVDLQRVRASVKQVAAGENSAILAGRNNVAFSIGSVVLGGKGNNAGGGAGTITNISVANPTVITSMAHGLVSGQRILISGATTTPTINGVRKVTWTGINTFTIPVNVTAAVAGGSWSTASVAAYAVVSGGTYNRALGACAHAEGNGNRAFGDASHVEGFYNIASGTNSHVEGAYCVASGNEAHAEGRYSLASGSNSHAEGEYTLAIGTKSHAEGRYSSANGFYSHAEGLASNASGMSSHAEGLNGSASGAYSHAEGKYNSASGICSHSEGAYSVASAYASHAGGVRSKAKLYAQWARSSGSHGQTGSAQSTISTLLRRTTDGGATELTLGGVAPSGTSRFTISDGQMLSCLINVVGRKENGGTDDHASFLRQACIRRESTTTSLVGAIHTIGTDINPASWGGVTITADDTNDSLKVEVTGAASTNIRWAATIFATEVADAGI